MAEKKKYVAAVFDTFAYICPYFTSNTEILDGYGCLHPKQEKEGKDFDGNFCGSCLLGGCPLGYSADDESLQNLDIDWQGDLPSPGDVEGEYIVVNISSEASKDERDAADKYLRYINRYAPKEDVV